VFGNSLYWWSYDFIQLIMSPVAASKVCDGKVVISYCNLLQPNCVSSICSVMPAVSSQMLI